MDALKAYVDAHKEAYLREIAAHFGGHPTTVFYALRRLEITLKKKSRAIKSAAPS